MRIYQLFHALIEKFVPMDKATQQDLQLEAVTYYNQALKEKIHVEAFNQEAMTKNAENAGIEGYVPVPLRTVSVKTKIISYLDQWYLRYIFALLFIYFVPAVKRYMAGDIGLEDEFEDEESEDDDFKEYQDFKRYKQSML